MKVEMEGETKNFYEFGPFRLDPTRRLLLRQGTPQPLTPKAFDILMVLVRRDGQVITKEDLMRAVWPDTVVEENNLTRNISALRKALGEGPHDHNYVVTVPGRGYTFVAAVKNLISQPPDLFAKNTRTHVAPEEEISESSRKDQSVLVVRSIAVLPFQTLSGAPQDEEYLGLGMADALITRLSNLRAVVVRPTSAVRKYTAPTRDSLAAGREQSVEAVLEGTIQRTEDRIRVTVQLVSVQLGMSMWSGKFDERSVDIFAVQDTISEQVARAIVPHLSGDEEKQLAKRPTHNPEAYQFYLKGRFFWNKRNAEGFQKAVDYFQRAIDEDPNYALAYAGLSDCYSMLTNWHVLSPEESVPKAKAAAMRALELDDTLAEAHCSLAGIRHEDEWDFAGAEQEFRRAIMLNPNYATAHQWFGEFLTTMGRYAQARLEISRALEIDPLSLIINLSAGWQYYMAGQTDESITQFRKTIEMDSNFYQAHAYLGIAYARQEIYGDAATELQRALDLGADPIVSAWLGHVYAVTGKKAQALRVLDDLKALSQRRYISPYGLVIIYAGLGEKDLAFNWLYTTYEKRDLFILLYLKGDPMIDTLRSDPRFADLLTRMRFEPEPMADSG